MKTIYVIAEQQDVRIFDCLTEKFSVNGKGTQTTECAYFSFDSAKEKLNTLKKEYSELGDSYEGFIIKVQEELNSNGSGKGYFLVPTISINFGTTLKELYLTEVES